MNRVGRNSAALPQPSNKVKCDASVAVAGVPNVGKSTLFNALTGMKQHTGNWTGKTVSNAEGRMSCESRDFLLVDIPGTYSLLAHSAEEEVARNYICFGDPDATVVVCDATNLEHGLNLALQTIEIGNRVLVCVNLLDEARKKGISVDLEKLSETLGVPVVGTVARKKKTLDNFKKALFSLCESKKSESAYRIAYPAEIEAALSEIEATLPEDKLAVSGRWVTLRLLENDETLVPELENRYGTLINSDETKNAVSAARETLEKSGTDENRLRDIIVSSLVKAAEAVCLSCTVKGKAGYSVRDRRFDGILTGKAVGYPLMVLLLALVFWITISGANYPSELLSSLFARIQDMLTSLFAYLGAPDWLHGMLVLGAFRVLAWVVAVMLPPMAIFFPLFTLLEDSGYLPRIAYNLDRPFKKCSACGKQALTMCMGFGCNAVGVTGARIIDSPRERLLAILTNCFVPCNGRFPMMLTLITAFFAISSAGFLSGAISALAVTGVIIIGVCFTFLATKLLSLTLLKGVPSSFTLELPPYRRPQFLKVIERSLVDRTLFVLGRACAVAAPAGLLIWLLANIETGGASLLTHCADFLNPFASLFGLDGVIMMAFILGFPANETVIPIVVMAYLAQGSLIEMPDSASLGALLVSNGWTLKTAVCTILFSLLHWPCSTTLLTVKKETGSIKWTVVSFLLPTAFGLAVCFAVSTVADIFI